MKIEIKHDCACLSVGGGDSDDTCLCGKHTFIERLRALRLWHWKMALSYREQQVHLESFKSRSLKDTINRYKAAADRHLTAVQTLNEFFPIGDTAERDANNES